MSSTSQQKVALILGAGMGLGRSLAAKWAHEGYLVACVSKNADSVEALAKEVGHGCRAFVCDITDSENLSQIVARVEAEMGAIDCLIYSTSNANFKKYDAISHEEFQHVWAVNVLGLLIASQIICPKMAERGRGVVAITGATASLRGFPDSAGYASAKAAQRSLAQSLARELGPKGVHVFHVVIDSHLDVPKTRAQMPTRPGGFIPPSDVANVFWNLASQPPTCWTFELDIRPNTEQW